MEFSGAAIRKMASIVSPGDFVRPFVSGGGCSGMSYGFMVETEQQEDDLIFPFEGVTVIIDPMSYQYLDGARIDYVETAFTGSFCIEGAEIRTCGCGSSFTNEAAM